MDCTKDVAATVKFMTDTLLLTSEDHTILSVTPIIATTYKKPPNQITVGAKKSELILSVGYWTLATGASGDNQETAQVDLTKPKSSIPCNANNGNLSVLLEATETMITMLLGDGVRRREHG